MKLHLMNGVSNMIAIIVVTIMLSIFGVGLYQIYLDNQDKKKNQCPCGGNCKCNEQKINLR